MASKLSEKAVRYLELLDAARCQGNWDEVPELARKIGKHAPNRACIPLTARIEHTIATRAGNRPLTLLPETDTLLLLGSKLEIAIENEKIETEDIFHAKTALGWSYWVTGENGLAISKLPTTFSAGTDPLAAKQRVCRGWTYVCMVKCAYIRGSFKENIASASEAIATYDTALPDYSSLSPSVLRLSELRLWTELLLARCCTLSMYAAKAHPENSNVESILAPFRKWAQFWSEATGETFVVTRPLDIERTNRRRRVWQAYFITLSHALRATSTASLAANSKTSGDSDQTHPLLVELAKVEGIYENLLLKDVSFPEASKINTEVDQWVDQVMSNWNFVNGPASEGIIHSPEAQLFGSRKVLDTLYQAATRTFHSTSVLRHLFTVHASLAEFELAQKALDSYLEIVSKGKARIEKSGQPEPGLDSDEVMLRTLAKGIDMLCTYGKRKEAARAQEIATYLDKWLQKHDREMLPSPPGTANAAHGEFGANRSVRSSLSGKTLAAAHRAVGVSRAHWARLTYEPSERFTLQSQAIDHLKRALRADPAENEEIETLYALAVVLAETRDLEAAVATIKTALLSDENSILNLNSTPTKRKPRSQDSIPPRLIKCWHLLALLLSARHEFEVAETVCESTLSSVQAFNQLEDGNLGPEAKKLSFYDRQHIIELKMTQVALGEVTEGPEYAVNAGGELLSLYASLFAPKKSSTIPVQEVTTMLPPPTANGKAKSFRESMFRRHRDTRSGLHNGTTQGSINSRRLSSDTTRPPTIAITDEDQSLPNPAHHAHHLQLTRENSRKLRKRNSKLNMGRSRTVSPNRTIRSSHGNAPTDAPTMSPRKRSASATANRTRPGTSNSASANAIIASRDRPRTAESVVPFDISSVLLDRTNTTSLDIITQRMSASSPQYDSAPLPHFPRTDQERYALGLLVKIWILMAGLYRRAKMFDDSQGAVNEALKTVEEIESLVAKTSSSSEAFLTPGCCGAKSVEELWADAYAERGNFRMGQSRPYDAIVNYEAALSHFSDHLGATFGLANILVDIYTEALPPQAPKTPLGSDPTTTPNLLFAPSAKPLLHHIPIRGPRGKATGAAADESNSSSAIPKSCENGLSNSTIATSQPQLGNDQEDTTHPLPERYEKEKSPEELNRLASRDRAYGMLSSVTKLGSAWDSSEAWFALARAYEESGQLDRAKEVLWWVVELEEKKPIRGWASSLGQGFGLC